MKIYIPEFNKAILGILVFAGLLASCGDPKKEEDKEALTDPQDTIKTTVVNINGELFSVPSPVQTALLIQKTGIEYDKSVLSASNKVNTFSTDYSRALNLGIFGADLGYVSLYNQTQDALSYLAAIKQLSDKLGISAAFDPPTMKRLSDNITNKDSMMVLVGLAYRASDAYLKNNQRTDISGLILAGGWIESMHFSVSAYKSKPGDAIRFRIAEQKQALNSILKILSSNTSVEVTEISALLTDLSKIYNDIRFKYTFVEPTTDASKQLTYINSTTEVSVTDEQLGQISKLVDEIRAKIVKTTKP